MSTKLLPVVRQRFFDDNGAPLAGGKVYSFVAGTTTPATTYTDASGLEANPNPVILDANGEADIWLGAGSYKIIVKDVDDVQQSSTDNVSVDDDGSGGLTSPWLTFDVTGGQTATILAGATIDLSKCSSAVVKVEIIRGTTIFSNGEIAVQNVNGVARIVVGSMLAKEVNGVTFTPSQNGLLVDIQAALNAGPDGTIKLNTTLVPIAA